MSSETLIKQSRWGSKTRFNFGEDKLEFSLRDFSGEASSSLFYNDINLENRSTITVNVARRYYFVMVVVALVLALILEISGAGLRNIAFLPLILAVLTYYSLRYSNVMTVTFTVLRPASGAGTPIRIIRDKKHDEVLQLIKAGWVARLRKLYLAVNFANDANREVQKFKWLLDHEVISNAEYQDAIAQLQPSAPASRADGEQVVH